MKSIRVQLACGLLGGSAILIGCSGWFIHLRINQTLRENFDRTLVAKAAGLASLVEPEVFGLSFQLDPALMPEYTRAEAPEYFQIWYASGQVLKRSTSLREESLPNQGGSAAAPELFEFLLANGTQCRAAGLRVDIAPDTPTRAEDPALRAAREQIGMPAGGSIVVVAARNTAELRRASTEIFFVLLGCGVALMGAFLVLAHVVLRRALRPVAVVAHALDTLEVNTPLPNEMQAELPREIEPFRLALLQFRTRVEQAFEREKRLTNHIAHELRTPIAELRTLSEVARMCPDDLALHQSSLADANAIARQMQRQLEACLRLARIQSGQEGLRFHDVELRSLLSELTERLRGLSAERQLTWDGTAAGGYVVRTDPALLDLILANLLENALHHAPRGSWVRWQLESHQNRISVRIENPLPSLADEDSNTLHLGLGLTTVHAASSALGTQVRLLHENGCYVVELELEAREIDPADAAI